MEAAKRPHSKTGWNRSSLIFNGELSLMGTTWASFLTPELYPSVFLEYAQKEVEEGHDIQTIVDQHCNCAY